jgi:hypothetical protein
MITENIIDNSKEKYLNDLLEVGPGKPLGYLPLPTIELDCGVDVQGLRDHLEYQEIDTIVVPPNTSKVPSGALYAYDQEPLQNLLDNQKEILKKEDWPIEAHNFVKAVAHRSACSTHQPELFTLIADCFADYDNPGRMDR